MALANGTIAYCLSHVEDQGFIPPVRFVYVPVELDDEVRLIDSSYVHTIVTTSSHVVWIDLTGNVTERIELDSITQHTPVQLIATNFGCMMITSGKTLVSCINRVWSEVGDSYVSISGSSIIFTLLSDDGTIYNVYVKKSNNVVTVSKSPIYNRVDTNGAMFNIIVAANTCIVWNEEVVLRVHREGADVVHTSESSGTLITKCEIHDSKLWILDSNGDMYNLFFWHTAPPVLVDSGYLNLGSKIIHMLGHGGGASVLVAITMDGRVENVSYDWQIDNIPVEATRTCTDMFIPNKRIKSAVS